MALSDDLPALGALGSLGALAGDIVLHGGEFIGSALAVLISSPDLWVSIILYVQRLGNLANISTAFLEPVMVIGVVLMLIMYVRKLIARLLSDS